MLIDEEFDTKRFSLIVSTIIVIFLEMALTFLMIFLINLETTRLPVFNSSHVGIFCWF